jgi:hypothetical protein
MAADDRIYAVIKTVGQSSDGKSNGLMAPRLEGEILAMRRAYEQSGIDPASIGLIEAHGTGIPLGSVDVSSQKQTSCGEMHEGEVSSCELFEAGEDSAIMFHVAEHDLDLVSFFVESPVGFALD